MITANGNIPEDMLFPKHLRETGRRAGEFATLLQKE
jgi:hypothetical protein